MDFVDRRLPVYLVADCSESMLGETFDGLTEGMSRLAEGLRRDPMALETVWISVIAFANKAEQVTPLTEMYRYVPPTLRIRPGTALGAALELVAQCIQRDVRASTTTQKGDWKPLVYVLTDGSPTDDWRSGAARLKATRASVVAIACGEFVDEGVLFDFADQVYKVGDGPEGWLEALKFVSASIAVSSVAIADEGVAEARVASGASGVERLTSASARSSVAKVPDVFLALRCGGTAGHYLVRFRRESGGDRFLATAAHVVDDEYVSVSDSVDAASSLSASQLKGLVDCPHCGNSGAVVCACGVICCSAGQGSAFSCPACGTSGFVGGDATGSFRGRHG